MLSHRLAAGTLMALTALIAIPASGQGRPDPAALMTAQREAMTRLAMMDGVWRGRAWMMTPTGEKHELTQTERVGPFLDGTIRIVEGRGYEADGSVSFNAMGVISYDPAKKTYAMRSYAQGRTGDFSVTPTADGFTWDIPAGPMTIRYTAVIKGDTWHETGDRIMPEREPIRFFEMTLKRIGDSDWPAGGAVAPN